MSDRVLLTADRNNIEDTIDLAVEFGLGLELMAFAYPDVLDGNWKHTMRTYRSILRNVPGPITIHGPFMDLVGGSPDTRINEISIQRYQHAIHIASELEVPLVVFHANFIGSLHNVPYRKGWHQRNVPFWRSIAEHARHHGITLVLENMWEFDPYIIGNLLQEIDHPNLKACLDIGHAFLFSDSGWTLQEWIDSMAPWLVHTHMNNNNGRIDEHRGFDWIHGVLDYSDILTRLRNLPTPPNMVLEMWHAEEMRDSLHYFELALSSEAETETEPLTGD